MGIRQLNDRKMKRVSVLLGGWSSEREISISSGKNVAKCLAGMGYDVTEIDVRKDLGYLSTELHRSNPEFIFNILHGEGGEDGVVQGILDVFGVPYSGCNVLSSAICFDKAVCKTVVKSAGVRVVDGFETDPAHIDEITNRISYPFVVKPATNGSSFGVFIILNDDDWGAFQNTPWTFGNKIIVEKYIRGREFTVAVLDGKVLGSLEITYKNETYDYESKYVQGASFHIANFEMPVEAKNEMLSMSETAFSACGCSGVVRIDFRYDGTKAYFLEVNTQPGMTELSLVPDIAKFAGISFGDLLRMIINSSVNSNYSHNSSKNLGG